MWRWQARIWRLTEFIGVTPALHGRSPRNEGGEIRIFDKSGIHLCGKVARGDAVTANAFWSQFNRQGLGQAYPPALLVV